MMLDYKINSMNNLRYNSGCLLGECCVQSGTGRRRGYPEEWDKIALHGAP
jgi:hypothetical protein